MNKAARGRRTPGYENLIVARGALMASVAMIPTLAAAETCTQPPPAPTSAPLAITCQDDATPVLRSFRVRTHSQ